MKKSLQYLGHIIARDGIGPDPKTLEKIANYKMTISADEIRSFLGLAGYYRRFIPNFVSNAQPLTAKTHKDVVKINLFGQILTRKHLVFFVLVLSLLHF